MYTFTTKIKYELIRKFRNIPIVYYYMNRAENLKSWDEHYSKSTPKIIETLLEGLGSPKNIDSVSNTIQNIRVVVKFSKLLKENHLRECGGVGLTIQGNVVSLCLSEYECRVVSSGLRRAVSSLRNLVACDEE